MRKFLFFLFVIIVYSEAEAQYNRHIVQFRDKGTNPFSISNPSAYLSARSITRRTKYNIAIDSTDLPVTPRYVDSLRATPNVTVLNVSKWLNQVAIFTNDPAALAKINSFPFVISVQAIAPRVFIPVRPSEKILPQLDLPADQNFAQRLNLNYGQTQNQIQIHRGDHLHNLGFLGEGMIIAMFDGGFASYKTNPVFDSARLNSRIIGEWDYVDGNTNTDESTGHGMNCFSTIAANRPGIMVGSAIHARYWLFRTEDVASEYPIEEQNWIVAAEFSDSAGVDLISSSLGYQDFDDPSFDYLYPERDGNTAMVTRAADLAAKKGMIVVNSAGNYGAFADQRRYISCPADGDSVVTVGAVNAAGTIASFSSWGPNAAGKVKPNVVSVGQGAVIANAAGNPVFGNGTSFSAPNMAGLITCLWGAFPEFSNMKIIGAVYRNSNRYNNPDDRYGYGLPDFYKAYYELKSEKSQSQFGGTGWFRATPNPFTDQVNVDFIADDAGTVRIYFRDISGARLDSAVFITDSLDYRTHVFTNLDPLPAGAYSVEYKGVNRDTIVTLQKGVDLLANDWIKVLPNPAKERVYVHFRAQLNGRAHIALFDARGRKMISDQKVDINEGQIYNLTIDGLHRFAAGVYVLRFFDGKNERSFRVLKSL